MQKVRQRSWQKELVKEFSIDMKDRSKEEFEVRIGVVWYVLPTMPFYS